MEDELVKHLKQLADQFHGLAPVKCRELAFEYAENNNIPVPVQGSQWELNCSLLHFRIGSIAERGLHRISRSGLCGLKPHTEAEWRPLHPMTAAGMMTKTTRWIG
ncbi:unnamed protein product [Pleuronectes platessa]|uniref:Uncharacterized protein n=1 Tax=Pleuronectes platessa TaxID=8262 RepID=A0A9N7UAQ9_PLEPL|nr:unnamed protein product [Pleuronectes platessa]